MKIGKTATRVYRRQSAANIGPIADIGDSMMQDHGIKGREQDCLAVSQIARFLLQLDTAEKFSTAVRLEAEDFVNQPLGSTIGELLRVRTPYESRGCLTHHSIASVSSQGH